MTKTEILKKTYNKINTLNSMAKDHYKKWLANENTDTTDVNYHFYQSFNTKACAIIHFLYNIDIINETECRLLINAYYDDLYKKES